MQHSPWSNRSCDEVSPGSVDVEAVDVEGEQGDHVREQREGKGEAQASRQAPVPQNPLDEGRHQVDVAWGGGAVTVSAMTSNPSGDF